MTSDTVETLKARAKALFGRDLSDAEIIAYGGRLPVMLMAAETLRSVEARLAGCAPADVYRATPSDD